MQARGREFVGTALTIHANETREPIVIQQEFNSITPENAMKWESTEPTQNNFTFADADAIVAYAEKYDLEIHCHNLVWHSQLPPWVTQGNFTNSTLIGIMENHIKTLVTRYKGHCTRWDVVNEALNENGTYRSSVWYDTIGEAFLPIAFKLARKYDDKVQLYYNDYNLEFNAEKTQGAARIVSLIKSYGVEIDGVGYQGHVASETTPTSGGPAPDQATLEAALHTTADLGVKVAYTELDVRLNTPSNATSLAMQDATWTRMAASCLAVEACVGITVWGISDKYSWIPSTFPGEGDALLFDNNYMKKEAYNAFLTGIATG